MFNLYIGANNKTQRLERAKIRRAASRMFTGYTLIDALGVWNGTNERSLILQIQTLDRAKVLELAALLKKELDQEAIGLQHLPDLKFI